MKKFTYAVLPLLIIAVIAGTQLAFADNEGDTQMGQNGPNNEKHMLLKEAITNNDYQAFLEAAPDKMLEVITEENFPKLVEAHEHLDAAHAIFDELGLKPKVGPKGFKGPKGKCPKTELENQ